jgi:hypothetical protein
MYKNKIITITLLSVFLLSAVIFALPTPRVFVQIPPVKSYECEVFGADAQDPVFTIMTPIAQQSISFADTLCLSQSMKNEYGRIRVEWVDRGTLSAKDIIEQRYDMFWNRENILKGLVPNFDYYYRVFSSSDYYRVYWYSNDEDFEVSAAYFYTHKVGLLNNQLSQSGFLLPIADLDMHGINFKKVDIHFFDSLEMLQQALAVGEVDTISGYALPGREPHKFKKRISIVNSMPTGTWFIPKNLQLSQTMQCELFTATQVFNELGINSYPGNLGGLCQ